MTLASLHPEELFDRPRLSPAEQARFEAHLRACSTCRAEQALRADFAEELAADRTPPFSAELLSAALGSARAAPAPPGRLRPWLLFAAALCTLATLAGAQHAELLAPASTLRDVAVHVRPPPPPPVVVVTDPMLPAPPPPASPPRETAASLFDEIATARRHRDYEKTIAACRALQAKFPASQEAQVSRGTLGRLLLDRGDAEGALTSFGEYERRGGGELEESVLVGRATAFERLGRAADARRTWSILLDAYPRTPYADQARARMER